MGACFFGTYVGLGAYTAASLYVHFGIGPWLGVLVAVPVAGLAGAFIGFLAFRFRRRRHFDRRRASVAQNSLIY